MMNISEEEPLGPPQVHAPFIAGFSPIGDKIATPHSQMNETESFEDNYSALTGRTAHGSAQFEPISIPIFAPAFSTSSSSSTMTTYPTLDSEDEEFAYDERVEEELEDSVSDSSSENTYGDGFFLGSAGAKGDSIDMSAIYDGLTSPRRSHRERRLPPQLLVPLPKEIRTLLPIFCHCAGNLSLILLIICFTI